MKIGYSKLTDTMYLIKRPGEKEDITNKFIGSMIEWICQGEILKNGCGWKRSIVIDGEIQWEITCKNIKTNIGQHEEESE